LNNVKHIGQLHENLKAKSMLKKEYQLLKKIGSNGSC
jgi:hypothetical protein